MLSDLPPFPTPNVNQALKHPDRYFGDQEKSITQWRHLLRDGVQNRQRRINRKYMETLREHAELGAVFNGFSLTEGNPQLATALEKIGQAHDTNYVTTTAQINVLEVNIDESLHEQERNAAAAREVLAFRHIRHLQAELTKSQLERKRRVLRELRKAGGEPVEEEEEPEPEEEEQDTTAQRTEEDDETHSMMASSILTGDETLAASTQPHQADYSTDGVRTNASGGLLGMITGMFNGILDVDAEGTRRSQITRTRHHIRILEERLEETENELMRVNAAIRTDLIHAQQGRWKDLRNVLIEYAQLQSKQCHKNSKAWEEAKNDLDAIQS
jgi:sorting nexin-4